MFKRVPFIIISIGIIITIFATLFRENTMIYIAACLFLFLGGGILVEERRKKHEKFSLFLKKEFDILIIMIGILLMASKFLLEEPLKSAVHLLALSTIFISMGLRRMKQN